MRIRSIVLAACGGFALLCGGRASAQGKFSNFETPQTHPIEVASVGGADYVLVCNTPDNSVMIYEAAPPHALVQRVPVGMGPGTVRWNAGHGRFYTCNFDGDSVTVVRLDPTGPTVTAVVERTDTLPIGDEPADIVFDPTNAIAAVSLSSRSSVSLVDALTLAPAGGLVRLTVTDPTVPLPLAVKMPRASAWLPDGRFFVANLRGGSPDPSSPLSRYDLGIYRNDPAVGPPDFAGGLGSTNHAFAFTSDGSRMFLVGTKAQNHAGVGVQQVRQLTTGFVQSWMMVIDTPAGGAMTVRPEALAGPVLPAPQFRSINLNRNYGSLQFKEVAASQALVQPTDVLLIEDDAGAVVHIVLTAFHSDRVAVLRPSTSVPGGYSFKRLDLPILSPGSGYSVVGPRGVAHSALTGLVYVNGRLDNTLAVIDPVSVAVTAQIQMQDPTPLVVREGRQFLYSARFSIDDSGPTPKGGKVSCAVCHVDGRTDGLPWDLGDQNVGAPIPAWFHDGNTMNVTSTPTFPTEKADMVTQTLQGLVNYELNEAFQAVATNAPYHWRGDKADFTDFNEAFVNLQGMDNVGTPTDPKGISDTDMIKYRRFVNTILHPPNPEQNVRRLTTGTLGADPNDPTLATGAKLGMMLFHDFPMVGTRTCVGCHPLPDGSSNTSTLTFQLPLTVTGGSPLPTQPHPLESAATRNIAQREMVLHDDFSAVAVAFTANSGILHPGDVNFLGFGTSFSINTFMHAFPVPGPSADVPRQHAALTEFLRQLDTGVAPAAGAAYTVDPTLSPIDTGLNLVAFTRLQGQVEEANVGMGVYTRNNGTVKGYWYDVTQSPPMYREEGTANLINLTTLLNLAVGTDNVVIAQGTPLGGERRWASATGTATLISDPTNPPSAIRLRAMAPNTAFVDIPKFNLTLNLTLGPDRSTWTLRTLQQAVVGLGFGVPAVRHEPPRRFRVTGDDIRPGARLLFAMASGQNPASLPIEVMEMELYPTTHTVDGDQVWETMVELDATQTFALLNGGYWAPDVVKVLLRQFVNPPTNPALMPTTWNQFLVAVQNEDQSLGFDLTDWQALSIQDFR